jgi:hypothetical protein
VTIRKQPYRMHPDTPASSLSRNVGVAKESR